MYQKSYSVHESIDFEPATVYNLVNKNKKGACRKAKENPIKRHKKIKKI
jgi:hypothetical protein